MSAMGSCSATWNETRSLSAARPVVSTSTKTTPAAASLVRAAVITVVTWFSMPAQNDAGVPMRKPRRPMGAALARPVTTASSSAMSATLRAIGPTVSRVRLIGTTALVLT